MQYKDYYKTLGVDESATQAAIKKAYRKLAKDYHPDTHPGNQELENKFKELNEAYEVLGDPEKRKRFDQLKKQQGFQNGVEFDPHQYGFNFSRNSKQETYNQSKSSSDFSDFFEAFFGGASGFNETDIFGDSNFSSHASDQQELDVEAEVSISLDEAYHGTQKQFIINLGNQEKKLSVKIPAGIVSGERIKLKGQGHRSAGGSLRGDLFIRINILSEKNRKIEGLDIYQTMYLSPWEAALGAEITIESLDSGIKVKIPSGSQSGKKMKLSGKGYRDRRGKKGDLYLELMIKNPESLSASEKKHYEILRDISKYNPRKTGEAKK